MRLRRIAPWLAAGVTVSGVAFAAVLNELAGVHGEQTWVGVAWAAAGLASSGVGLVLALRRAGQPDRMAAAGERAGADRASGCDPHADYTVLEDPGALPGGEWAVLFHERAWPTLFIFPTAIALLFPDGRLPSPRWRPVAIVAVVSFAALTLVSLLLAGRYSEAFDHVSSPRSCPRPSSGCRSRSAAWARWQHSLRPRWPCGRG
jgi:hypothetical protein